METSDSNNVQSTKPMSADLIAFQLDLLSKGQQKLAEQLSRLQEELIRRPSCLDPNAACINIRKELEDLKKKDSDKETRIHTVENVMQQAKGARWAFLMVGGLLGFILSPAFHKVYDGVTGTVHSSEAAQHAPTQAPSRTP